MMYVAREREAGIKYKSSSKDIFPVKKYWFCVFDDRAVLHRTCVGFINHSVVMCVFSPFPMDLMGETFRINGI